MQNTPAEKLTIAALRSSRDALELAIVALERYGSIQAAQQPAPGLQLVAKPKTVA